MILYSMKTVLRRLRGDLAVLRGAFWGALGATALPLLTTMNDSTITTATIIENETA